MRTNVRVRRLLSGFQRQKATLRRLYASIPDGQTIANKTRNTQSTAAINNMNDYFQYTSGRWLYNEALRQNERYLKFNILALQEVVAKAVQKSTRDVISFRKLAEGGFNRTFVIGMNDGREVIARLPCPIAFPSRLTVASEVATLGLVQTYGVPVPEILGYSTTTANPVGAEYILMDKAAGEELGERWFSLPDLDRAKIIGRLSQIENVLFSIPLPASGSIFYKRDLDESIASVDICGTEFCIGPSIEQRWWYGRRGEIKINRGPFQEAEQFLVAGAEKELSWLRTHGRSSFPKLVYREINNYQKSIPEDQIKLLEKFLQITPYLMPTASEYQDLLKPTLRHPDLNPRNIFVDENLKISSLIDWQHCSATPLFLETGVPDAFENFGDAESVQLKKPALPLNFSSLSAEDQAQATEQYRRRHLHFYYFAGASKFNKIHYKPLRLLSTALKQRLCFNASSPWQGNPNALKASLIRATQRWDTLTAESVGKGMKCPISFTEEEVEECLRIDEEQDLVDEKVDLLRETLGIGKDGWISTENYDFAVAENQRLKEELLKDASEEERRKTLEHWPFDDHSEDDT